MPCECSYQEPTLYEKEADKIMWLQEELNTGSVPDPKCYGTGYHKLVYNRVDRDDLDESVAYLCLRLSKMDKFDIQTKSLELQMWWRDHQEGDKKRQNKGLVEKHNNQIKQTALEKLTKEEQEVLGLI